MNVVINLNKPKGISSQQAVTRVKRITGVKKAGHAGTLDPMATGILLVCTGEATKITRFLSDLDKEYLTMMKLGEKTDTYDSEGAVVQRSEGFSLEQEDVENVLSKFRGTIEQIPPMFSALKMGGRPLYSLARRGIMVERARREVTIHGMEITGFSLPFVEVKISCSKGTYIRSLCNDIGETLGMGAHITSLQRTRIGRFRIEDSITLDELQESPATGNAFVNIDDALGHLGEISLDKKDFDKARNGLSVTQHAPGLQQGSFVRVKDPSGHLFAIGRVLEGTVRMDRVFHLC
ncbi:MAG TPA: tRNA pseudouridine(55) synthase TruB [Thermodesulfovibrionales bacterium]|nr:tRNA pseudouridine(55) synthase TruB [Thermodesulfovibrionales bacterium]